MICKDAAILIAYRVIQEAAPKLGAGPAEYTRDHFQAMARRIDDLIRELPEQPQGLAADFEGVFNNLKAGRDGM